MAQPLAVVAAAVVAVRASSLGLTPTWTLSWQWPCRCHLRRSAHARPLQQLLRAAQRPLRVLQQVVKRQHLQQAQLLVRLTWIWMRMQYCSVPWPCLWR